GRGHGPLPPGGASRGLGRARGALRGGRHARAGGCRSSPPPLVVDMTGAPAGAAPRPCRRSVHVTPDLRQPSVPPRPLPTPFPAGRGAPAQAPVTTTRVRPACQRRRRDL